MKIETGTNFTAQSTQQAAEGEPKPAITMMSDAGKKLASVSAPSSAFMVRTSSTEAVREK
jgi:hypothetical protein